MATTTSTKYIETVGRRKTSTARVRITEASKTTVEINSRPLADYFKTEEQRMVAEAALNKPGIKQKFHITAHITGGGMHSQAEALRHGIARAIIAWDKELRGTLKTLGFLKRDPRAKERRKFGLKKARKAPQWSKR